VPEPTSTQRPVIVLDPGHGGSAAAGGSSPNHARGPNGLLEKDVVLDLAKRVQRRLTDCDVRLTRDADVNLSLASRSALARDANANLFLSIHLNGSAAAETDGAEAWVAREASPRSRALADALVSATAAVTRNEPRGVRTCDLGVLVPSRHSNGTAACLLEALFLTNPRQAHQLENDAYRDALAGAIAASLRRALETPGITHACDAETAAFGAAPITHQEVLDEAEHRFGSHPFGTYANLVSQLRDFTLFGRGVRLLPSFHAKLRAAETAASAHISDFGISTIGSFEDRLGLHGFGLAIDIDANANPYVMHEAGEEVRDQELRRVYHRIALMMTGEHSVIPEEILRGPMNTADRTARLFDALQNESSAMRGYWALLEQTALADFLQNIPARDWRAIFGDDRQPTVQNVLPVIARDWVVLSGRPGPAHPGVTYPAAPQTPGDPPFVRRDPLQGFMNLRREVVVALTAQRLRWGAVDFPGVSGDVMHFDDGATGFGAALVAAHHALRAQRRQQSRAHGIIIPLQDAPPQREEYQGRAFSPANGAAVFRGCAPTPVAVSPATLLPVDTVDADAAIRHALTQNGVGAAAVTTFHTRGGFAPLRPIARLFGATALTELIARLRYTPEMLVNPPHDHGRNLVANLGVHHAAEILAPRLLAAIPGHFRELARRAPDPVEAHALENLGWLIMRSLASRVGTDTGKQWWLPPPPQFVTPFSSTLPAFSPQVHQLIMRTLLIDDTLSFADYNARVRFWQNGLAGQQWQLETGRAQSTGGAGLPFYPQLVTIPAAIDIAPLVVRINEAWTRRLAETDAQFPVGSPQSVHALQQDETERLADLHLTSTASLGGIELVNQFPLLTSQAARHLRTTFTILTAVKPTIEQLYATLAGLGWNDLLFETQGSFVFRGNKIANNPAAARRLSNHGRAIAMDLMVFENPPGVAPGTIDPRIVLLMESHHCRWGRCFPTANPHHFEYCGTAC
jgi:N-acetylmuramoyl-L-alanine amidase